MRLNSVFKLGGAWYGFYDGAEGKERNYEELCGVAKSEDLRTWTDLAPEGPALLSPYASRSVRYVFCLPHGDRHAFRERLRRELGGPRSLLGRRWREPG